MSFRPPMSNEPAPKKKVKRYGWYREYNGDISNPRWRMIADKLQVPLPHVISVRQALNACASIARRNGWIGDFDFHECATLIDIPVENVAAIYRMLEEIEWIAEDHIAEWCDRNPDEEDPTAAERQRRRRARIVVRRKIASGVQVTEDEAALLASRVTGHTPPPSPQRSQPLGVFLRVEPENENDPESVSIARVATAANARVYLLGSGTNGPTDWGAAAAVVADKGGMRVFAADSTIRRWLSEIEGDAIALAELIDNANHGGVSGEAFERVVRQGIARHQIEKHRGPQLPLRPVAVQGDKRG